MCAGCLVHLLELLRELLRTQIIESGGGDELVAEAGHDEQRVVDAHGQADHGGQHRRHVGDRVGEDCGELDAQDSHAHADDGRDERHTCGHEGTEGDEQDDGGNDEADDLRDHVHLGGAVEGIAAVLHGEVTVVVLLENVGDRGHLFGRDLSDGRGIEVDGDRTGAFVLAERGECGKVGIDLLLRHALRGHFLGHLLLHSHGSHDRVNDCVGVLQRVGSLQLLDHGIDFAHDRLIRELFALRSLQCDGGAGGTHCICLRAEALHHLLLGDGGVHVWHGKSGAWRLREGASEAAHRDEQYQPEREERPDFSI